VALVLGPSSRLTDTARLAGLGSIMLAGRPAGPVGLSVERSDGGITITADRP
jgi:hypothetical protein